MSHDDKEQLEPPRWTPNFGPFDESALLMEIIAMWGVHGAHAQVCRMLIERAALSASVEQPMVYWSERDDNGEWQHYRATPEHAGKVMTERFAGRTAPIGPDNCLLSTEAKPKDSDEAVIRYYEKRAASSNAVAPIRRFRASVIDGYANIKEHPEGAYCLYSEVAAALSHGKDIK